jgi:hypothetical protein
MIRTAIASVVLLAGTATAGDLSHKANYSAADLKARGIGTVAVLIDDFAKAQSLAINAAHPPVFLVEGRHQVLNAAERESALAGAGTVELMSDGEAVVVNVRK